MMISSKFLKTRSAAIAVAAILGLGTAGAYAEDPSAPVENSAPAATDDAAPAAEPAQPAATDATAAPADTAADKTDAPASNDAATAASPSADPAKGTDGAAEVAPVKSEAPQAAPDPAALPSEAAPSEAATDAAPEAVTARLLTIGAAVFAADGAKIGQVNRVTAGASGKVEEILVTAGGEAGLNAKVIAIPGDKITGIKDGVQLSLSSEQAKKLPIIGNGNG